jgi:type VI secretion system protein ImpK
MREEIAEMVYPIFRQGLRLRERLKRGNEKLNFADEQAELKRRLRTPHEALAVPAFGGDGDVFLGLRYALACWLDEVFILDSPWQKEWNERKIEEALYGSNERAYKFWEQARRAESRLDSDAVEGFYLCVMLGFRGDLRDEPAQLQDWRESVETQLNQGQAGSWQGPPELPLPPTNVPPLRGKDRLRWLLMAVAVVLGCSIVAIAFTAVSRLGGA